MKKRGTITHEAYFIMIEIFLVLSVSFFLFNYVNLVLKDTTIERTFLSRDLSLLTNVMYSAPGNIFYNYQSNINLSRFDYWFYQQNVNVVEKGASTIAYPFLENPLLSKDFGSTEKHALFFPKEITFQKTKQKMTIKETITPELKGITCPLVETKADISNQKILLDPGRDYVDKGAINTQLNLIEYELTLNIAEDIERLGGPEIKLTRINQKINTTERVKKIKDQKPNITISIHIGNYSSSEPNILRIYYNAESTKKSEITKLACLISNRLIEKIPFHVTLPIDLTTTPLQDKRQVLNITNQIIIYLEIGNIQSIQERNILRDFPKISAGIKDAIKTYYS